MKKAVLIAAWALTAALMPMAAYSDDSSASGWNQEFLIYLLGPTIEGTAGIGPAELDVDIDAESVFENLDGAFLGMYAAERDDWGIFIDTVYMDLEADLEGPGGLVTGELGNKQLTAAAAATRRVSENWQLMGGLMYTDIKLSLDVSSPLGDRSASRSESWVDPFVGARVGADLSEKWHLGAFGYIGGFGVGSDLMWSLNAGIEYQFSERNAVSFLYRYISFDYDDGEGLDRFLFDIAEHGPAVGWHFRF